MQIILLEKVLNLGNLGEVVRVKDGYARNFLIPQGKAKRATKSALADFEAKRVVLEAAQADKLAAATSVGERLNGLTVQISSKSGVDGRLFGSITNQDVAEALGKQGYTVHKSQVRMAGGALKTIGDHAVQIALHTDVLVDITMTVVGQAA
jgi:large subunit ribosomal protein L9